MKASNIFCFVTGALIFGAAGVFAGQYIVTENSFPIQVNGSDVKITGYNIDDSTYFKLRDIADAVGGFTVNFANNTIQIAKDGYKYDTDVVHYPGSVSFAPDYHAITGDECTDELSMNDLSLLYGAGFKIYDYKSSDMSAKRYIRTLLELGFKQSDTNANVFSKDNNYIELELGDDWVSVNLYLQYNPETKQKF